MYIIYPDEKFMLEFSVHFKGKEFIPLGTNSVL